MLRRDLIGLIPVALAAQYEESRGEAPWAPTPDGVIHTMLRLAHVGPSDIVYDLGCGDGRIVIMAAQKYGARGVGVDIEPVRIEEANEAAHKAGVADRVKFIEGDLFQVDVAPASVVTLYLFTKMIERLKPALLRDLRSGSRVVSYQFNGMGDWKPKRVVRKHTYPVYYWEVPQRGR
jgi:SAM-dependent methyltransferase